MMAACANFVFLTDEQDRQDRRWWSQTGSNRRPPACKAGALPAELWPRASDRQFVGTQPKARNGGPGKI
jgi:hypothetical protein